MQRVARSKEATGQLKPAEAEAILQTLTRQVARGDIPVVEFESIVETEFEDVMRLCYSQNPPVLLRTADAIHLASARVAHESEIVSTDRLMRQAAVSLGFTVFPPP